MKQGIMITLMLALIAVFPFSAQASEHEIRIGVITSLSGSLATGGNVTKQGYDLWEKKVNEAGGINVNGMKYPVKLIYADAQSEPSQAASGAERLATRDKVDFVFGPYSSGVTLAAAPVLRTK